MFASRLLCVCAALVCLLCAPKAALAEEGGESAQALFEEGAALFDEERYEEALVRYRKSYVLEPSAGAKASMIICLFYLERLEEATIEYDSIVTTFGATIPASTWQKLEHLILEVGWDLHFGLLRIITEEHGRVWVDGKERASLPWRMPIRLAAGPHELRIERPDGESIVKSIVIAKGGLLPVAGFGPKRFRLPWPLFVYGGVASALSFGTKMEGAADAEGIRTPMWGMLAEMRAQISIRGAWVWDVGIGAFWGSSTFDRPMVWRSQPPDKGKRPVFEFQHRLALGAALPSVGPRFVLSLGSRWEFGLGLRVGMLVGKLGQEATEGKVYPLEDGKPVRDAELAPALPQTWIAWPLLSPSLSVGVRVHRMFLGVELRAHWSPFSMYEPAPDAQLKYTDDTLPFSRQPLEVGDVQQAALPGLLMWTPMVGLGMRY